MSSPNLNCKKCNIKLNYLPYHSYAEPPAMKSKAGEFYCFDCFKSISNCKVCGKSVAQMEINIHDKKTWYQPWEKIYFRAAEHIEPFDMCGSYCDFLCSPECFAQDDNRHYEVRMKNNQTKLAQGWKYCEDCREHYVDYFSSELGFSKEKCEKILSDLGKPVPPSEKFCNFHKRCQKKDRYIDQVIYPKAQKWWDSLTYAEKLAEVKRQDIHWIIRKGEKECRKSTHEEVANEKGVPPWFISQKFEREEPCIGCGKGWKCVSEINCGKNSPDGKTSYCASCPAGNNENDIKNETKGNSSGSNFITKIKEKEVELSKLKESKGENSEEVRKLEEEIKKLLSEQNSSNFSSEKTPKKDYVPWIIGSISVVALIGFAIVLTRPNKKNPKIK